MHHRALSAAGLAAAVAAATAFPPAPANAQQACAERIGVLKQLDRNHKETPQALGVTPAGQVLELLVSDKGSWTIIVTAPSGVSCLVAFGQSWQNLGPAAPAKPAA